MARPARRCRYASKTPNTRHHVKGDDSADMMVGFRLDSFEKEREREREGKRKRDKDKDAKKSC